MNPRPVAVFTGGHHTSALEVAQKLIDRGWQIVWIGHKHSMWGDTAASAEYREVTGAGIEFIDLKAGKVYRTFHPAKLVRVPAGFIRAWIHLYRLRNIYGNRLKGIITFGGYLGVPVVVSGWLLGLPIIAHEQTAAAGWANRIIAHFARRIAVTWPASLGLYPTGKSILVGLPIRRGILAAVSVINRTDNLIYVTGGKQGSHVINQAVFSALSDLLGGYRVIHQTGSSTVYGDFQTAERLRNSLPTGLKSKYQVFEYLDSGRAAAALSRAGVVISRSGAHIVYELGLLRTKAVLIPIPWSSHAEQLKNARMLQSAGLAVILPQSQLTADSLLDAVSRARRLRPGKLDLPQDAAAAMVRLIEAELLSKP